MKIGITGDLCLAYPDSALENPTDVLEDYRKSNVLNLFKGNDFNIANLEAPITRNNKSINKLGPAIKNPSEVIDFLKISNVNIVSLANNHINDFGTEGIKDTLSICKKNNINTVGAGNINEHLNRPLYFSKDNVTMAIIACSENEFNSINGSKNGWGTNTISIYDINQQIREAKQKSDFIIMIMHGGHEQYKYPSPRIKKLYRLVVDLGVDAVIGHHPHLVQGHEVYNGAPIFYSIGNFFFPSKQPIQSNHEGILIEFTVNHNQLDYEIIPYQQCLNNFQVNSMDDKTKDIFFSKFNKLSQIILDDELLKKKWKEFSFKRKEFFIRSVFPFHTKIISLILKFGIDKKLISQMYYLKLINFIRCESHRDLFIDNFIEEYYDF